MKQNHTINPEIQTDHSQPEKNIAVYPESNTFKL
jgi:hypothetical protein